MRTYTGPQAAELAGITYRQLDYWVRSSGVLRPARAATGCGSRRTFTLHQVCTLRALGQLARLGAQGVVLREVSDGLSALDLHDWDGPAYVDHLGRIRRDVATGWVVDLAACRDEVALEPCAA